MSNNKITQFSYFYWNINEKKADKKTTLFHDETCHDCDIAFWKNASWDTILSPSGSGLKIGVRGYFSSVFSGCCAILTSPKKGETAVYGYNPTLF